MLSPLIIQAIIQHANEFPQQEVCGYVLNHKVYRSVNVADEPQIDFLLDGDSTLKVIEARDGRIPVVVYHSHVNGNEDWSLADIRHCRKWRVSYFLYHQPSGRQCFYDPNAVRPYAGREFHWLTDNCYTLIQDAYRQEFQISLPDFYLNSPEEYNDPTFNRYLENIEQVGFIQIPKQAELKKGDLIVTLMGTPNPAHGVMVWNPEENTILEHFAGRLSQIRDYGSMHRKYTHSIWRHKDLLMR